MSSAQEVDAPSAPRQWRTRLAISVYGAMEIATMSGLKRVALLTGMFLVGLAISLGRVSPRSWGILWAEDGTVFLTDAVNGNGFAITAPYAGYMHLVPRVLAVIAAAFPIEVTPYVLTFLAASTAAALAVASFVFLETRIRSKPIRFAAWAAVIALPIMGGEVVNSIANLHWFLLIAAFCALSALSRGVGFALVQSAVVLLAVASDPLGLLLAPFALLRLVAKLRWRDRWVTWAFAIGAGLQASAMILAQTTGVERDVSDSQPTFADLAGFYAYRVALTSFLGIRPALAFADLLGVVLPGMIIASAIAVVGWAIARKRDSRVIILAFAASSVAFVTVVCILQWDWLAPTGPLGFNMGQRYFVVPTALLLIALLLSVDAIASTMQVGRSRTALVVIAIMVVAVPAAVDYRVWDDRSAAPTWDEALDAAAQSCGLDGDGFARPVIAPVHFLAPSIPCALVTAP